MEIFILNVNEDGEIYAINGEGEPRAIRPVSLPTTQAWSNFHVAITKAQAFLVEFPNDIVVLTTQNFYSIGDEWGF